MGVTVTHDAKELKEAFNQLYKNAIVAEGKVHQETMMFASRIYRNLVRTAPRQSGAFAKAWTWRTLKDSSLAHHHIYNDLEYAPAIELGVEKGDEPWGVGFVNKKATKRTRVIFIKDRIWSTQAVGGTINPYIKEYFVRDFCRVLAGAVMKGLTDGK